MANEHVLVVGAGQMGAGIAQVALTAGLRVTLVDVAKDAVDKGAGRIRSGLGKLREKGKLDEGAERAALGRLTTSTSAREVKEVDVSVIREISWSPTQISPADGWSSPAIRLSSVVLPEPDGPIRARNSPSGTSRLRSLSTSICSLPRWKNLWTSRTRTIGSSIISSPLRPCPPS